jgi:periplasmic protein TonB
MVEQTPVAKEEPKPEPAKPADDPPPLGTGIKGDGAPDGFNLSGSAGSGGTGRSIGGTSRNASKWGWYAAKVQSSIADALRRNPRLRSAVMDGRVRIWADPTGRITRASWSGNPPDPSLDAAITAALTGLSLPEPPPADMPAPIVLRLAARRP